MTSITRKRKVYFWPGRLTRASSVDGACAAVEEDHGEGGGADEDGENHGGDLDRSEGCLLDHFQLSLRYMAARIIAPMLPTAADSVGVAIPRKIEPSTRKIRINGGRTATKARPRLPVAVPSLGRHGWGDIFSDERIAEDEDDIKSNQHQLLKPTRPGRNATQVGRCRRGGGDDQHHRGGDDLPEGAGGADGAGHQGLA